MGQKFAEPEMQLYRAVNEVLHFVWDPIGVSALPAARDEYEAYLPDVFRLIQEGRDAPDVAARLGTVSTERMGLAPNPARDLRAAQVMIAWKRTIDDSSLPPTWTYHGMQLSRAALLRSVVPLESVLRSIIEESRIEGVKANEACTEDRDGRGSHRVEFLLWPETESAVNAIDTLLNGVSGIRCRYAADPDLGAHSTRAVCGALASAIVGERVRFATNELSKAPELAAKVLPSLILPSAKVWFDRDTDRRSAESLLKEGRIACASWQPPESEYGRLADELLLGEQQVGDAACKGPAAPRPKALEVKGAWVWDDGREFVVPHKQKRSLQIHRLGWT